LAKEKFALLVEVFRANVAPGDVAIVIVKYNSLK
jgi:hypothetical protein